MSKYHFEAVIKKTEKWPNAGYVDIPEHIIEAIGGKGRIPIQSKIDGIPYQGSLVKMGMPTYMLIILKGIREQLGKNHGDVVAIELGVDHQIRKVEIPNDLKCLFKTEKKAHAFFKQLSYTHQKEYVNWISSAKREDTKKRRLAKMMDLLNNQVKHP